MTNEQFDRVVELLTEIRDESRALRQALLEAPPDQMPPPCTHPPELRNDQTFGAPFWRCNGCGYVYDNEQEND
jgi:hypothetical protein